MGSTWKRPPKETETGEAKSKEWKEKLNAN
jgi:hypothetical protein